MEEAVQLRIAMQNQEDETRAREQREAEKRAAEEAHQLVIAMQKKDEEARMKANELYSIISLGSFCNKF